MGSTTVSLETNASATYIRLEKGDRIYQLDGSPSDPNNQYILLGVVDVVTGATQQKPTTGTTITVTLETPLTSDIVYSTSKFSAASPFTIPSGDQSIYVTREVIVPAKSLSTDISYTNKSTSLVGTADKGINFITGQELNLLDILTKMLLIHWVIIFLIFLGLMIIYHQKVLVYMMLLNLT
jgi:hypothetical protein